MFLLFIACSSTEKESDSFEASPHTYEANLLESSDVDLTSMAQGVESVLSDFLQMNAVPVLAAYDSLMVSLVKQGCPLLPINQL